MNFRELPQEIGYQIFLHQKEIQQRFSNDEVLDQLDQLKYDPVIQTCQHQLLIGNKLKFDDIEFENITLALWSFLYVIRSPIIFEVEEITNIDVDLFFYLLQTKDFDPNITKLFQKSLNYCQRVLHLELQRAVDIMQKMSKINFRVLNMFPRLQAEKKPAFNADWITSLVTKVVQVSSYTTQQLYKDISVCEIYYMFAQYCRQKGSEAIYLRTQEEIVIEEDLRCSTIIVEYLIQLGHIDEANKTYYINKIHNIVGGNK